jgi:hypothetical protein
MTAPAAMRRAATGASCFGRCFLSAGVPPVVGMAAVSMLSLSTSGRPSSTPTLSDPALPDFLRLSDSAAAAFAPSGSKWMKALSEAKRAQRSANAAVSSDDEILPSSMAASAAVAVSSRQSTAHIPRYELACIPFASLALPTFGRSGRTTLASILWRAPGRRHLH